MLTPPLRSCICCSLLGWIHLHLYPWLSSSADIPACLLGLQASLLSGILGGSICDIFVLCMLAKPVHSYDANSCCQLGQRLKPPYTAVTTAFSRWPFANRALWWHSLGKEGLTSESPVSYPGVGSHLKCPEITISYCLMRSVRLFFNAVNLFNKYGHFLCNFKRAPLMYAQIACIQILLLCSLLPVFTVRPRKQVWGMEKMGLTGRVGW